MNMNSNPAKTRRHSFALSWLRRHARKPMCSLMLISLGLWSTQVRGASLTWEADGVSGIPTGGTGTWDTSLPLWDNAGSMQAWNNLGFDTALFGGTPGTVTLGNSVVAGGLTFNVGGYSIVPTSTETLTLTPATGVFSPVIAVNNNGFGANQATISAILAGSSGFTKMGNGTLRLTNTGNTFTGDLVIKQGTIVVDNVGQLGASTGPIQIFGVAQTGNPGYTGGALVLQGNGTSASATGLTLSREVTMSGRGPGAVNATGSLVSVGYNAFSGGITSGGPASQGRMWATHGATTISGDLHIGAVSEGFNTIGDGNFFISGKVTGAATTGDSFIKYGMLVGTTMWLQNANNTFAMPLRIDSGTVRVQANGALGLNNGTGSVDLNNGTLEARTDLASGFAGRSVRLRNNTTGTVFVDHDITGSLALGSSLQNQTVTFGSLIRDAGANTVNFNYAGRNGYNISFTSALPSAGDHRAWTINNNTNGTVTYNGNTWNTTATTAGTYTVQGNAETVITGSVLATGAAHNLTKAGSGTFYFGGTANASNYTGATTVSGGTLSFSDVGGFSATSQINVGNATTTAGTLTYTGPTATLNRTLNLNTTTASVYLNASGTGALTIAGPVTAVTGNKTVVLGGTSTADNTISSVIPAAGGTLNLQKIGSGTWVLAPVAGNNLLTGSTTVSNGTLKLQEVPNDYDILPNAGAVIFNVDTFTQSAGGRFTYVGAPGFASAETVGALTGTMGHGIIEALPVSGGSAALTFASLGTRAAGASINVLNTGIVNITGTSGFVNAGVFFNGADFAYSGAGTTLRAPVYGTDAGFVTSASALTAGSHNEITGSFSNGAAAVNSLKVNGANTLTLTGALTVGTAAGSGIILTGGSGAITGGSVATSAAGNDLQVRVDGAANTLTLSSPITTSTAGLTKSGNGILILGGANTYSGTVSVNEGTLQMGASGLLGATNIGLNVRQGATFDLNGVSVGTVASGTNSVNALNGAGTITNTGALATLRVGNNNSSGYFTGAITGSNLHLVKAGSGTLSLTNNTSTFGTLTISGGTVSFALPAGTTTMNAGAASPIGLGATAADLVFNGGALQYTGANGTIFSSTQSPSFSTDRLFTLAGNGTIQSSGLYGNNVLVAGAQNNASIIFSNTGPVVFSGAGTRLLTLGGNSVGDNEFRPQLVNNGGDALSLTKADGGLWILNPSSANTYTGTTTISGGALRAIDGTGLSSGSNLTINGGVFETSGTFTRTLGAAAGNVQLTGGASGFAAATPDRLVVTLGGGAITWGGTTFNPSSLVLGSSTALGETEITNNIAIGATTRTITVNNNGNTGTMVTAGILSGVISGSGAGGNALIKNGGGVLILGNANTYTGSTRVDSGNLVVTSIGTGVSSSLGASGAFIANSPGTADLNPLIYVGGGEVANRDLTLSQSANFTGDRNIRIEASGSGALVWNTGTFANTTRGDTVIRNVNLDLRGSNVDNNMMNLVLTNSTNATFPNRLQVVKNDGGTWVLNPASANTFTGAIVVGGGSLGLTANGIGSASGLTLSNASIFGYGGALTIPVTAPITHNNNTTAVFSGQNNITVNGTYTVGAGNNAQTMSNNLENGAVLTFNGNFINLKTDNQTMNWRGFGNTVWNGVIPNGTGTTSWNIAIDNNATFTFGGGSANTYTGTTTLAQGTLILNKTLGIAQIGNGSSTFNFAGGVIQSAVGSLTGANALGNALTFGGDPATFSGTNSFQFNGVTTNSGGNRLVQNTLSGGANLTLANVNLSNDNTGRTLTITGSGTTNITGVVGNGGTGAGGLAYSGNGTLNLTGASTATGALTVNRGTIVLGGASGAWTAGTLALNANGTLQLDNSGANDNDNRLFDTGAVAMTGGTLTITGNAAGTTETAGVLTVNGMMGTINMTGAGPNTLTFASVNFANSGSSLDLTGVSGLGSANKLFFTAAPTLTNSILPRTMIAGDFTTYGGTNGVEAFTGYNTGNNFDTALNADTMEVTGPVTWTANRTLNALKIDGSGLTIGSAARTVTLTAGAILNTGGNNTLTAARYILGGQGFLQVDSGTALTVNGAFTNNTINKVGAGTLALNSLQYFNATTNVSGGTLELNGGLNTLFANGAAVPGILQIDAGATVDLKGNNQYVGNLGSIGSGLAGTGGTLTTTSGAPLFVTRDGSTFGGQITGNMNIGRIGGGTFSLTNASSVAGTLTLLGGTTSLRDDATLLGITGINVNYGTLELHNNTSLQIQNSNRIADSTPITLRGGSLTYNGRVSTAATETLGGLTLDQGANTISIATGGGTITSAVLTIDSLTRNNNATVNFGSTTLGQEGNLAKIFFTTPLSPIGGGTSGALGAWAIANSTDYAAYNRVNGVGIVGQGGYVGYDPDFGTGKLTQIPATAALTTTLPAGTTNAALLRLSGAANNNLEFTNATDVLNLEQGGLLRSNENAASTIGTTTTRGILTSGIGELITYNAQNTLTIHSVIQGATKLVKDGAGTLTLTAPNTYSAGTVVNRGTMNVSPTTPGDIVIPAGGLTIQGGVTGTGTAVNLNTSNAIHSSTDLVLNGRSGFTMAAGVSQTLDTVTFDNNGGEGNPTITVAANGVLTLGNSSPIAATSSNAASTATITGGTLALGAGGTLTVAPIQIGTQIYTTNQPTLNIASAISSSGAALVKAGNGLLQLSSANSTFSNGLNVTAGGIVLGASSTTSMSGPLGTGTTAFSSGTSLWVDNASRTVSNPMTWAADPIFNNTGTTQSTLTLDGAQTFSTLTTTGLVMNIPNPFLHVFLGNVVGAASVTDIGQNAGNPNTINMTGLGSFGLNLGQFTNAGLTINLDGMGGGPISLLMDGDGTMRPENLVSTATITSSTAPILTIGRAGAGVPALPLYTTPLNKTIQPAAIPLQDGITLTNNNGYGLLGANAVALNSTTAAAFSVSTASASNLVAGLTISGQITGGDLGAGNVTFTKTGNGVLKLTNATNSFGNAGGSVINIADGILEVTSDGALGDSDNIIRLSSNSGTEGFRASGTFSTARTFNLNAATTGIDVTGGNALTLTSPFTFSAAANALQKNDNGTLIINADNVSSGWTGTFSVTAGAVQPATNNALGGGSIAVNAANSGAAIQLTTGGLNIARPLNLNASATNLAVGGINFGGQLENVSGTNTWSGAITMSADAAIGARAGSTLNITGGLSMATTSARAFYVNAESGATINFTTTALTNGAATSWYSLSKYGAGTLDIQTVNNNLDFSGTGVQVHGGTLSLSGAGTLNDSSAWTGTNQLLVDGNAIFKLDNSGSNVVNRTNGGAARPLILSTGKLDFVVNGGASSSETFGALTSSWGNNAIRVTTTAQSSTLTFASLASSIAGGSVLTFQSLGAGANFGTAANKVIFTTAPTLTNGILARGVVIDGAAGGVNFATYTANGIEALTSYVANINTAVTTDNVNAAASATLAAARNVNSLTITGPGVTVDGPGGSTPTALTVGAGGILVRGAGTSTLGGNGLAIAQGTIDTTLHVASGSTLNLAAVITSAANFTKGLDGNLSIDVRQRFNTGNNWFTINGGTVTLNAGENTLWQGIQGGAAGQNLAIAPGATLDLNGNSQMIGTLRSPNNVALPDTGGILTNSGAAATLVSADTSSGNWGGSIQDDIFFNKAGAATLTMRSDQTYTGDTLLNGGTISLVDNGRLSGTGAITMVASGFNILDNGLTLSTDRVKDTAALTVHSTAIAFTGRDNTNSYEKLGDVHFASGNNNLNATAGGGSIRSAHLEFGALTHTAGATVNLNNISGQLGSAGRVTFSSLPAGTIINNIIPWMIDGGSGFVSYITPSAGNLSGGLGGLGQAGYAGHAGTVLPASNDPTGNYSVSAGVLAIPSGGLNINALDYNATAGSVLSFANNADVLNLTAGAFIRNGDVNSLIGSTVDNGRLTVGGTGASTGTRDLYFFPYNSSGSSSTSTTLNVRIIDNPVNADPVRLTISNFNASSPVIITNGQNSYTGGTIVNASTLVDLNVAGADGTNGNVAIPAATILADSLVINRGIVRLQSSNQIDFDINPLIADGGLLNLNNNNQTLAGLTFNNRGNSTATEVRIGTGTLTLNGNVTADSWNAGAISTITSSGAGSLALNGAVRTFDIDPVTINSNTTVAGMTPTLNITALITGDSASGINKIGDGILQLSNANTYGGTTAIAGGTIRYGIANALPTGTALTLSGTGTLDLNNFNATIGSLAGTSGTVTNSFFSATAIPSVTLTTGGDNTSTTYSGVITQTANSVMNLTKTGTGTMTLSGASSYIGRTWIQNGALSVGSINSVVGGTATSNLGAPTTSANGAIFLGSGADTGTLIYTGAGETTDRMLFLAGTTGGGTIQNNGGTLVLSSSGGAADGNKTLAITAGTVQLAASRPVSIIPDNVQVNLTNATGVLLDLNGNSETFGSLAGGGATGAMSS